MSAYVRVTYLKPIERAKRKCVSMDIAVNTTQASGDYTVSCYIIKPFEYCIQMFDESLTIPQILSQTKALCHKRPLISEAEAEGSVQHLCVLIVIKHF